MLQHTKHPFTLFQRPGGTIWSVRFSAGGKQIRKSLNTEDEAEAHKRAYEIWGEATYRVKNGLAAVVRPFSQVAEEFIELVKLESERNERSEYHPRDWPPVIRRYLVGYFGDKPIDAITAADIEKYLEWRRNYWMTGPGKDIEYIRYERRGKILRRPPQRDVPSISRQRGELIVVRALFNQSARWGYSKAIDIPEIKIRKRVDNRRPSFTPEEYTKLVETALKRMESPAFDAKAIKAKDGREWMPRKTNASVLADRSRLYAYIQLMANSGMRTTEAKNLKWGNILGYKNSTNTFEDVRLQVRGKGKHGDIVPLYGAVPALQLLWSWFEHHVGREPNDDDPVLANEDGIAVKSFNNSFKELLKAAGLERDHRGVPRVVYSLRHYYISKMIADGVPVHDIARNTRTSIAMIDKHYAQVSTEQIKDSLRAGQKL